MNKFTTAAIAAAIGLVGLGSVAIGSAAANAAEKAPAAPSSPTISSQHGAAAESVPALSADTLPAGSSILEPGFSQSSGDLGVSGAPGTNAGDAAAAAPAAE